MYVKHAHEVVRLQDRPYKLDKISLKYTFKCSVIASLFKLKPVNKISYRHISLNLQKKSHVRTQTKHYQPVKLKTVSMYLSS